MENPSSKIALPQEKDYRAAAFLPLVIFFVFYLGFGLFFYIQGESKPFNFVPREAALVFGVACALLMGKRGFSEKVKDFSQSAAHSGIMLQCLIFLLAGMFSSVSRSVGGVAAVVNAGMAVLPANFIVPGLFIIACIISFSMGTSFGTVSAVAPIAVGFAEIGGYNMVMVLCAVIGGAMFGDNLSFISDTTIAATQGAGCAMKDKFRMNFKIALPAAIIATILYAVFGTGTIVLDASQSGPIEVIKLLPYLLVLILAFTGLDVIYVLGSGIVASALVGIVTGSTTFFGICADLTSGIGGMYSICLMAFALKGIVGLIQSMGGINWLMSLAQRSIKSRRGAQYFMAGIISLVDVCVGNNTICIMLGADVLKPLAKRFKIAPARFASLLDIFACIIPGLSPIGINVITAMSYGGITNPFAMMQYAFYLYALGIAALITIHFNLLQTKEEKEGLEMYPELDFVE